MDRYRKAKERLFTEYEVAHAVINVDDPVGQAIAREVSMPVTTVGAMGDISADDLRSARERSSLNLRVDGQTVPVSIPVIGEFNVSNALVAAACCRSLGLSLEDVVSGLETLSGVPGRFELVSRGREPQVIVDYAHTPDGVAKAIKAGRGISKGRVIAVVGAGGDRDVEKRPSMGAAAGQADLAVITSDNPRSEDPRQIVKEVAAGLGKTDDLILETDRADAIRIAIESAEPGDVVLILGKGHEPGQDIGGQVMPFDDREIARGILAQLEGSAGHHASSGSITA